MGRPTALARSEQPGRCRLERRGSHTWSGGSGPGRCGQFRQSGTVHRRSSGHGSRDHRGRRRCLDRLGCSDRGQSVKTTSVGGVRGYNGAKKLSGRQRPLQADTQGLVPRAKGHSAV